MRKSQQEGQRASEPARGVSDVSASHVQRVVASEQASRKQALLETLAFAYERHDKGQIDSELFGALLERLQAFLEGQTDEGAGSPARDTNDTAKV